MSEDMDRLVTRAECNAMIQEAVSRAILSISRAPRPIKIFGLNSTKQYSNKVAQHLGLTLTSHNEKSFDDGETFAKSNSGPTGNVRGHNCFVIQSLYSDDEESVSDKFMKLCIMCGSLKDASAHEVTAVVPHLAWARQDRKTESRAPITTKYVARMIESVGIDRVLFQDVHNLAAEQNAFSIPMDNLESKNLHAQWCADKIVEEGIKKIRVLTPDSGGLNRCTRFRNALTKCLEKLGYDDTDIEIVIYDKLRVGGKVVGSRIIGDVESSAVIAYDDMISTGGTMSKACKAVLEAGGEVFAVIATHGLFCGAANECLDKLDTNLVVSDTVQPFRLNDSNRKKLHLVDTTKITADAIWRIHSGTGSISALLS